MAEKGRDDVVDVVKACLLSKKGGIPIKDLNCK
jgi:hypothetical protein